MRKKRVLFLGISLLLCFVFSGCGDEMYSLTEEEEQLIVDYSAKVVAKYNKASDVGVSKLYFSSDEQEEVKADEQNDIGEEEMPDIPDIGTTEGATGEATSQVSFGEAFGFESVEFSNEGFEVEQEYNNSDMVLLRAPKGKSYLVLNIKATNTSESSVDLDLLSSNPTFTVSLNGNTYNNETTILLNDLTTYQGELSAKGSADLVILFLVPTVSKEEIGDISLAATINGVTANILM